MIPRFKGMLNCIQLAKYFKNLNIDLIHSFHYGADYSEALSANFARIPWVYTKKNMNWGGSSKNAWHIRTLLASHILVQNTDMLKTFFINSKKTTLVPRGVDTREFKKRKANVDLLNRLNLINNKVILCVANLHPVKGVNVLFDAFHKLPDLLKNTSLIIVGDKENSIGKELQYLIENSPKRDKIHLVGKVNNVHDYYSIADLFVLPTLNKGRQEGCPVALLEGLASGLNVLGSNVAGIKDILNPFPANLFEAGNSDELAKKMSIHLTSDFTQINKKLIKHLKNYYSIMVEVEKHESIYKSILKS